MKPKIFALVLFLLLLVSLSQMLSEAQVFAQYVDTAWVRRYSGPGYGYDLAYAIAVDGSGNVYVTGESYDSATMRDYATVKYYPDGDTAWARTYNGPGNSIDTASAIAVDHSGNVYVTGMSYGSGTSADYATIKYYPYGDTTWVRRYTGTGSYEDLARAIAIDDSGNVYVTGGSYDTATYWDYATIKYYPDGDTAWVRRYDGPGNGNDQAYAMFVGDSGNVYVTGGSYNNGTSDDYATIKYYPNGDTAWVRRYDGPQNAYDDAFDIAVDDFGNVYVTGSSYTTSGTRSDYATIKYYPDGDTAWVRRYNGPGNSEDLARAIAVNDSGNVYVTGWSYDNGTGYDYATIKYDPFGNELWVRRYCGPGSSNDWARAIALDNSGNVYVTGGSDQSSTIPYNSDYATVKYYSNGDTAWVRRYNGPANDYDYAYAIAVDGSNNVYVTGTSWGTGTYLDYTTIKYVQLLCGDVNKDGVINSADVVYLINYLFVGGPAPQPSEAGDANCDGTINSADVAYLINYLFIGGPPPCEP